MISCLVELKLNLNTPQKNPRIPMKRDDEHNDEGPEQFVASDEEDDSVRPPASPEVDLTIFRRMGVGVTHLKN